MKVGIVMAFFFGSLLLQGARVVGVKEGTSKKGSPYVSLSVIDSDNNTNELTTSSEEGMRIARSLSFGDVVDLTICCAGSRDRQYAMIARSATNPIVVRGSVDTSTGELVEY